MRSEIALLALSIFIIMGGCIVVDAHYPNVTMPYEVQLYYNEYFKVIGEDKKTEGEIEFGKTMRPGRIAECRMVNPWTIIIDRGAWGRITMQQKKIAVFHELTHCIAKMAYHDSDPHNYMYPVMLDSLSDQDLYKQAKYFISLSGVIL